MVNGSYSKTILTTYDANRHVPLPKAQEIVEYQADGLDYKHLERVVRDGRIHVYEFDGEKYLDRLDIGRVYHQPTEKEGLTFERYFSKEGEDPLDSVEYERRQVVIDDSEGNIIFQADVEFPPSWDDQCAGIVAQKFFFTPSKSEWQEKIKEKIGSTREYSIKHPITRVSNFLADKGEEMGYFQTKEDKERFKDELIWLQINRKAAFNSPTQFNAGIYNEYGIKGSNNVNFYRDPETGEVTRIINAEYVKPQCHACFIKGPRDDLESILKHSADEGAIFSAGSGIGQNIGRLREFQAPLSGGGKASGANSFLEIYDIGAATVKSGGKSRRAARKTDMNENHPDILEFVRQKVGEDKKALTLMKAGYSSGMDGEAYSTVNLQNTNLSVRLSDGFFDKVKNGGEIELKSINTGKIVGSISADRLLKEISFGAWRIGDPGVMYKSRIDDMHTCPNSGDQDSTNPCGEYMFIPDTSCNLGSLNLLGFADERGNFDYKSFARASIIVSTALDIINGAASYPVYDIAEISPEFATIGLGFANLGGLLMRKGLPYNSDEGRAIGGAISAIMTGVVYENSADMAKNLGAFTHFEFNKKPMLKVIGKHKKSLDDIAWEKISEEGLKEYTYNIWDKVSSKGSKSGFRNAQATCIAPTGTISYLMGSQHFTGCEPGLSLSITKNLSGGGILRLINDEIPNALRNLGYTDSQIKEISNWINEESPSGVVRGTVIRAPHMDPRHYPIFNTSYGNLEGKGSISREGHVKMMGALQPFITGGISKTNNFPENATVKDIYDTILLGNELGLKGLTMFRYNSKPIAALDFGGKDAREPKRGEKVDLPDQRIATEWEVSINGSPLHIIVSEYKDGTPGQIAFLSYTAGSEMGALLTESGILASTSLKRGVSLEDITKGWIGHSFAPNGLIYGHKWIKNVRSPLDFAGRLLRLEYLGQTEFAEGELKENVDIRTLRGYKSGSFRTYRRAKVDDWDIDSVLRDPEFGGFVKQKEDYLDNGSPTKGLHDRGVTCKKCGRTMEQISSNCFACNCGFHVGGCGG